MCKSSSSPGDGQPRVRYALQMLLGEHTLVWDNHGCMPLRPDDESFLPQLARYRDAGVTAVTLNVGYDEVPWDNTFRMLDAFRRWVGARPGEYLLAGTTEDLERARANGRLAVLFDIEGGNALNGDIENVRRYYDAGVRWMLIAYNRNNLLGGGCQDEDSGLTAFGRKVLDEMASVGMVACCSHTGSRTALEVMEYSSNPVIFSHSNPSGAWRHRRNISDELIRACARTGGVVGINGIGLFLGANDSSTDAVVRHIDYVVRLAGPEHVGLGLDYVFDRQEMDDAVRANPATFPPEEGYGEGVGLVEPERIPDIAARLRALGYGSHELNMILGGNWLRVARQVWRPAGAASQVGPV